MKPRRFISGHRTSSTFRRYDIVCNDDKVEALARLERAQQRSRTARGCPEPKWA